MVSFILNRSWCLIFTVMKGYTGYMVSAYCSCMPCSMCFFFFLLFSHESIFQGCRGLFAIWSNRWPFGFWLIFCLRLQSLCCFGSSLLPLSFFGSSLWEISHNWWLPLVFNMSSKFPSLPCFPKDASSSVFISSPRFFPLRLPPLKIYISHAAVISDLCLCNLLWPASSAASYGSRRFAGGLRLPSETSSHRAHSHTCLLGAKAPQERTLCACVCVLTLSCCYCTFLVKSLLHPEPQWKMIFYCKWCYLFQDLFQVFCCRNSTQFKLKSLKRLSLSCTGDILLLVKIIPQTSKWNLVTKRCIILLVLHLFRQFYHGFANVLHLLLDYFFLGTSLKPKQNARIHFANVCFWKLRIRWSFTFSSFMFYWLQTLAMRKCYSFIDFYHLCLCSQRPTPPLPPALEEDESCGPTGFWEALTPCNGCRNLGFSGLSQVHTHTHTLAHTHTHKHTHTARFILLKLDDSRSYCSKHFSLFISIIFHIVCTMDLV